MLKKTKCSEFNLPTLLPSTILFYLTVLVLSKDSTVPSSNTTNCKIKYQWNHITTEQVYNACTIYPSHNKTPAQNHK